jgi:PKD repeat protein
MDKKLIIFLGVFLILILGFILFKWVFTSNKKKKEAPRVDFVFPNKIYADSIFTVEDKTAGVAKRQWDFGDGQLDNNNPATHVYVNPGIYTIKLTVSGDFGSASDSLTVDAIEAITKDTMTRVAIADTAKLVSPPVATRHDANKRATKGSRKPPSIGKPDYDVKKIPSGTIPSK